FPFTESNNRFFPLASRYRSRSRTSSPYCTWLSRHAHGVDFDDMHLEHGLNCTAHIDFVCLQRYSKGIFILGLLRHRSFSYDAVAKYLCNFHNLYPSSPSVVSEASTSDP